MSLFPAYTSTAPPTVKNDTRVKPFDSSAVQASSGIVSALDWLKNDSYVATSSKQEQLVEISDSSDGENDAISVDSKTSSVETISSGDEGDSKAVKRLREDEENVREKSAGASTFTKAPIGAIFLEDLSIPTMGLREQKLTGYRLDRANNSALLKYNSIFAGHLSKYICHHTFALCRKKKNSDGVLSWKTRNLFVKTKNDPPKKKDARYFARSQLKRLKKFDGMPAIEKRSPLDVTNLPLVIKLKSRSAVDQELEASAQKPSSAISSDTPYDELKKATIRKKTEEFNRRLNVEQNNTQLWLDFVEFQNDVARFSETAMTEVALTEKKLAILDRALSNNPGNVQLLVEKIKLKGTTSSNQDAIAEEWRNIAFVHPNNADVWWECIMAICRRFSAFSIDKLMLTFSKCLSTMSDILDGVILSHRPVPHMEEMMLYIFIALVYLLREAGFTERAMVLFQCQIEFALFQPTHVVAMPKPKAIDELELYFSAGVPLFGQPGAIGWNKWKPGATNAENANTSEEALAAQLEEEDEIDKLIMANAPEGSTHSNLWAFLEEARMARRILPLPTSAPVTDDPERQVVFDDVSRFLVKIKSPENKYRLLILFLEFLGVDVMTCGTLDTFIKSDSVASSFSVRTVAKEMFASRRNDANAGNKTHPKLVDYNPVIFREIVNLTYEQAVSSLTEPFRTHFICVYVRQEMDAYQTALTASNFDGKSLEKRARQVKQVIRGILKEPSNRNNLAIWALCSECEFRVGRNSAEAVRIAETAIGVSHSMKLYASWGALCHLATRAAFYSFGFLPDIESFDVGRIFNSIDDPASPTIGHVVRVLASCLLRKVISDTADITELRAEVTSQMKAFMVLADLDGGSHANEEQLMPVEPFICQLAECFSLFVYLVDRTSSSFPLASADEIFTALLNQVDTATKKRTLSPLSAQRRFFEQVTARLHSSRIAMALFDYRTSIKPVTYLKDIVLCALNDFPNNRAFLKCLVAIREPAFLSSSFFKFVRSMSHRITQPLAWLEILFSLLLKIESTDDGIFNSAPSGGVHLIRSFFEKATATSHQIATRSCSLWALFIAFEAHQAKLSGATTSRRLESTLFRALQACPWAKEIYMAMARCRPVDKLQDAVDMIVEKGLRLCTLVDELDTFPSTSKSS